MKHFDNLGQQPNRKVLLLLNCQLFFSFVFHFCHVQRKNLQSVQAFLLLTSSRKFFQLRQSEKARLFLLFRVIMLHLHCFPSFSLNFVLFHLERVNINFSRINGVVFLYPQKLRAQIAKKLQIYWRSSANLYNIIFPNSTLDIQYFDNAQSYYRFQSFSPLQECVF